MLRKLVVFVMLVISLQAKSYIISPLLPPTQEVLNTSKSSCDASCMHDLFNKKLYLSFLSHYKGTSDVALKSDFKVASSYLDSFVYHEDTISDKVLRIALLMPQKLIGRYSVSTPDVVMSYLVSRGIDFNFKVFNSIDESPENLVKAYDELKAENYDYVIAILTQSGVKALVQNVNVDRLVYVPTVNINQIDFSVPKKMVFGGIDYNAQIKLISDFAKNSSVIAYNDDSYIGMILGNTLAKDSKNIIYQDTITSKLAANYKQSLQDQEVMLDNSMVVFNTSAIKSGLIIPQISTLNITPKYFLSTQINYNPVLLTLTQPEDVENLLVVNAIGQTNDNLMEYTNLLSGDLKYDWVNYATDIGVEMFLDLQVNNLDKFFSEPIKHNQVIYNNRFFKPKGYYFAPNTTN
ncbi:hypothetical protein BKH43_03355 [Helicobacter sp. 13S00401-1]|nr:hypothetical protein BKH43_03355 [Helicobacter sp. 13S00401-1]